MCIELLPILQIKHRENRFCYQYDSYTISEIIEFSTGCLGKLYYENMSLEIITHKLMPLDRI